MKEYTGRQRAEHLRFGIIVAKFNALITRQLLEGAMDGLHHHGADDNNVTVVWVPGSFEIPLIARKMASSGSYDALVCLGAIIRGSTSHADHIAGQVSSGVARIALETEVPIIFGILTTDTIEQALERAGKKRSNKGFTSAQAAIEMANLIQELG
ncbi:MAG: 6,7-dimethyl-8-ribityllumazine synthase [Waddliaceae bacterium]